MSIIIRIVKSNGDVVCKKLYQKVFKGSLGLGIFSVKTILKKIHELVILTLLVILRTFLT